MVISGQVIKRLRNYPTPQSPNPHSPLTVHRSPNHRSRYHRTMQFVVVIPARYASARLPGKPLADIAGKAMVVHVADRARESGAYEVIVATDDERIQQAVARHGHQAMMTRPDHVSGTDRIAEIASQRPWPDDHNVVNAQGVEPRMPPQLLHAVAGQLATHAD